MKVWRPLSISLGRCCERGRSTLLISDCIVSALHCLGVAGDFGTRVLYPPFSIPRLTFEIHLSPRPYFPVAGSSSFYGAHFIVLISLCSFPRWQFDIGRDLLGSHCFSAKITQPLFTSLLHPNDRSVQWVWSSIFTVSCHVFSVSRTNSVFHVVACVIASRKPAVGRTARRREIAFGESTLPHMEGI